MHPIFSVKSTDISALNDEQARELIARLCKADATKCGHSESGVEWGGDQRASDGGIDVSVDLVENGNDPDEFIPKRSSGFQVKAEKFPKSKIEHEMAPKGVLRDSIVELAGKSGAYVIASTRDSCSKTMLKARLKAMHDVLKANSLQDKLEVRFYDIRKIADWTERHPSVVEWLRHTLGKPLNGWQPYNSWAYDEIDENSEYLFDEHTSVFSATEKAGLTAVQAIDKARTELSFARSAVRLIGLSGVGKTRFVQALFDNRIETTADCLSSNLAIYTDISDEPNPQPNAMVNHLIASCATGIVIVDNCGAKTHQKLTETLQKATTDLRLVTVEYDISDEDVPAHTSSYRLESSSDDLLSKILDRKYPNVSQLDNQRIVEFSSGNARVAFALANTVKVKGELAQLNDGVLFERLFHQNQEVDSNLLRSAEVCSLVYSFDVESTTEDSELGLLASLAEVSVQQLYRDISELHRRGLVQSRGQWRALLPHAIANRLAGRALASIPPQIVAERFMARPEERIAGSFARRLSYLHESEAARNIVKNWMDDGSLLGELRSLSRNRMAIFRKVASTFPSAAMAAICKASAGHSQEQHGNFPHELLDTVRSLAYEPELFDEAIKTLVKFADPVSKQDGYANIGDSVAPLFYIYFSGTTADPNQRSEVVRNLLGSNVPRDNAIGRCFLTAALKTGDFQNYNSFEFGGHSRNYGWHPKTGKDINDWFRCFIDIASQFGSEDSQGGKQVRQIVAGAFFGLWNHIAISEELANIAEEFFAIDGWANGWVAVQSLLKYGEDLSDQSRAKLSELGNKIAPQNLIDSVRAKVLSDSCLNLADESEDPLIHRWHTYKEVVRSLGRQCGLDKTVVLDLLSELLSSPTAEFIWDFGAGVGQTLEDLDEVLDAATNVIPKVDSGQLSLRFLLAMTKEWANRFEASLVAQVLDRILTDECLGVFFPEFQTYVRHDERTFERLQSSLDLGFASEFQFRILFLPEFKSSLSTDEYEQLFEKLMQRENGRLVVANNLMMMGLEFEESEFNSWLTGYCIRFLKTLDQKVFAVDQPHQTPDFVRITKYVLERNIAEETAQRILDHLLLLSASNKSGSQYKRGRFLLHFFKYFPAQTLDRVYVPDPDGTYRSAERLAGGRDYDRGDFPIAQVDVVDLVEWCGRDQKRFEFSFQSIPMFADSVDDGRNQSDLSDFAKQLFAACPSPKKLLDIYEDRLYPLSWSGSLASIFRNRASLLDNLIPPDEGHPMALIRQSQERLHERADSVELDERRNDKFENERFE